MRKGQEHACFKHTQKSNTTYLDKYDIFDIHNKSLDNFSQQNNCFDLDI